MCAVRRVGPAILLAFLSVGTQAQAQVGSGAPAPPHLDRSFDLQLFHPAVGSQSFVTLDGAAVLEHRLWHFGLVGSYGHQFLSYKLSNPDNPTSTLTQAPVQNLAMGELVAAMGIRDRYEVGLALPMAVTWGGDGFDSYGRGMGGQPVAVATGDMRVEGKAELVGFGQERRFLFSLSAGATVPTGDSSAFLGEENLTGRVRALLELDKGDWLRAVVMVGGLLRETSHFLGTPLGPAALYGAAVELRPSQEISVLCEVTGRYASTYMDTNPAELAGGMRFFLPSRMTLLMGGGFGLNHGLGTPQVRAFVGLGWAPDYRDSDRDGFIEWKDQCTHQPEDWDGFDDHDGCPDSDNDGDGVPDDGDKCPNQAEDKDTFQDDDGCPDPDNDGDGVMDLDDACPGDKEDGRGKRPSDGCPYTTEDADGDGIHDAADKCPDEPEDADGFEDADGCPDYDNDADGIPDPYDACRNEGEDVDGFEDEDGCADPDNDHDGIPDGADKCPNKPETINYFKDEDGCPDPGPELVRLGEKDGKIYLGESIDFRTGAGGKPQLTMNGNMMAALVAGLLQGHAEVATVRIEVSAKGASKELTQQRGEILREALVKNGVDPHRLKVLGLGNGPHRVELIIESRHERQLPAVPVVPPDEQAPEGPDSEGPGAAPDRETP